MSAVALHRADRPAGGAASGPRFFLSAPLTKPALRDRAAIRRIWKSARIPCADDQAPRRLPLPIPRKRRPWQSRSRRDQAEDSESFEPSLARYLNIRSARPRIRAEKPAILCDQIELFSSPAPR